MSLDIGDARYPVESRVPFVGDDSMTYWMSPEDVRAIEDRLSLALAAIAVFENEPSWLRDSLREGLSLDDKRRYVELALVLLGKPRLFGWHRHEELETKTSPPPDWDQLLASGQLIDVSRKAHIHSYVVLASNTIAGMDGGHLQDAVIRGVADLRAAGALRTVTSGLQGRSMSALPRDVEIVRVRERMVVLVQPGEFGPFTEIVGRIVEYRRRTLQRCCYYQPELSNLIRASSWRSRD